jgi:hypothetical protein
MYRACIPVFIRGLKALDALLDKGAAHAAAAGIDPETLIDARLAPDMMTLAGQVQRCSDTSKKSAERLGGPPSPAMPDTEASVAELKARIAATVAYLETVTPSALEGSETREVVLTFGPHSQTFSGEGYLLDFALPNFFFHVAIAHGILRNLGVAVGKLDYLGAY